jgi:hypothetical protein
LATLWTLLNHQSLEENSPDISTLEAILAAASQNESPSITPSVVRLLRHIILGKLCWNDGRSHKDLGSHCSNPILPAETSYMELDEDIPHELEM